MKKIVLALFLALATVAMVSAGDIDIGEFPFGKWIDPNWNAVWEFNFGSVKIYDTQDNLIYDFAAVGIQDFYISYLDQGAAISFSCAATGKKYYFTKLIDSLELILEIERAGLPLYTVNMPMY